MTDDDKYTQIEQLYQSIVGRTGSKLEMIDGMGTYVFLHKDHSLTIELPDVLGKGKVSHVNIMAPLSEAQSPEEMIDSMQHLVRIRDQLRVKGYQPGETFTWYDDGAELVYEVPTESEFDLERLIRDLSQVK